MSAQVVPTRVVKESHNVSAHATEFTANLNDEGLPLARFEGMYFSTQLARARAHIGCEASAPPT
jgi:hypothetical protein